MSGCRLQVTVDGIHLDQFFILIIKPVNFYLVRAVVHGQDIPAVRHPSGTCYMGAEISLRHTAVTFIINLIHDLTHGTVLIQAQHSGLAVMVAGHKHILVLHIRAQMAAPHTAYGRTVQPGQASVLKDTEGYHTFICYGVQGLSIAGSNDIGGVVHFHLTPLLKHTLFHIHIIHCDSLGLAGVRIGSYICHIFSIHTCSTSLIHVRLNAGPIPDFSLDAALKTSYHNFVNLLTGSL